MPRSLSNAPLLVSLLAGFAPLLPLTKAGIIRLGRELGVDYGLTHS